MLTQASNLLFKKANIFYFMLISVISFTAWAQSFDYKCYEGSLPDSQIRLVKKMQLGLTDNYDNSSFIVYFANRKKYSEDAQCPDKGLGNCSIHDDGGIFKIVQRNNKSVTLEFKGTPDLQVTDTGFKPSIDSKTTLKKPIILKLLNTSRNKCRY